MFCSTGHVLHVLILPPSPPPPSPDDGFNPPPGRQHATRTRILANLECQLTHAILLLDSRRCCSASVHHLGGPHSFRGGCVDGILLPLLLRLLCLVWPQRASERWRAFEVVWGPRDANRPPSTRRSRKQGLLPHRCCSCASKGATRRRWVFRVSSECDHSSGPGARRTIVPWRGKCLVLWQFVCVCG